MLLELDELHSPHGRLLANHFPRHEGASSRGGLTGTSPLTPPQYEVPDTFPS